MDSAQDATRIVTFYSYKGGTGRSMALANVAWILAANGKRVAVVDWDLEAPGLHRYFHPYLRDPSLTDSSGVIDFVMAYAREAIKPAKSDSATAWYVPFANLLRHASSLRYDFGAQGTIDFIPSGRQGSDYAARVNSFNWTAFYEKHQGGVFLEAAKQSLSRYDYVLIDSRTGVSDTAGICTVQMPHVLVVCFTPNTQSIEGASAIARSADQQRTRADGTRTLTVLPVMTRVLSGEKVRVDASRRAARDRFDALLWHLGTDTARDRYWARVWVPQEPFYAFEEVLAVFADQPDSANTMLASMEILAGYILGARQDETAAPPLTLPRLDDAVRRSELGKFVRAAALPPPPQPSALETPAMASDRPSAIVRPAAPTPPPVQRTAPATRKWPAPRYWFYVSYAQTDADPYFRRFVEDLDGTIRRLVGHGEPTGFFGRSTAAPGASWTERVGDALASSRVLLAMVSPAFLHSDACGKEWQFFAERARHTGSQQPDILPVRWVRVHTVPKVISRREAWASGLPEAYREDGVQFLIRRSKYRDDYDALVHRLAQALIDAAGAAAIPVVMEPPRWETLTNAFQDQGAAAAPDPGRTVQFVFMVAGRAEMDPVRASLQTYGETAEDWTP
jgi:MinD-like ATPase involved in chromosome partitioning or flagellar assembly